MTLHSRAANAAQTTPTNYLRSFLQRGATSLGSRVATTPRIILTHGQTRTGATQLEWMQVATRGECFANSFRALSTAASLGLELRYVEGYAVPREFHLPFEHAWLEDTDGNVFETTWTPATDTAYAGVPFELEQLVEGLHESPQPMIFGDYMRGFRFHEAHRRCCLRG